MEFFSHNHPFMTVNQVAEALQITKQSVYKMMHRGALPWTTIPGMVKSYRISTEDFIEFQRKMRESCANNHQAINAMKVSPSLEAIDEAEIVADEPKPKQRRRSKTRDLDFFYSLGAANANASANAAR